MNLGKKIIEIRKQNKLSQEEFAELFNVSRQTISSWENSKSYPDIDTLVKISNKFEISLDSLLKGDIELVKEFDKKIKKGKKFNITIISIICVFLALIFVYMAINNRYNYLPSKGVVCTYENSFISEQFLYNRKKVPVKPGNGTLDNVPELLDSILYRTTLVGYYETFDTVDDLVDEVKRLYEETGATCEIYSSKNPKNADYIVNQKYREFRESRKDNNDEVNQNEEVEE